MAFSNFMQAGLNQLLQQSVNINAIASNAENLSKLGDKLYKHFCSPAQHLLPAYRQSYQQTLCALRLTLNPPFIPLQSKIIKDFQQDIKAGALPIFQKTHLYKALAKECRNLEQHLLFNQESVQLGTKQSFEVNLASFIGETQLPNLTDLILNDVQAHFTVSSELLQLLQTQDLLGNGIWHFLRADKNISLLIAALQQEQTFQRVIIIEENTEKILDLVRNIHRFAERAANNYADNESLQTLTNVQQRLNRTPQQRYLLGLTQAFRNPNISQAKQLMETALQQAQTNEEKALIYYSLFKLLVSSRELDLSVAFKHLKSAIDLDEHHYAPCDPLSFELEGLLGVGGMGYALLAKAGTTALVIKCFWQDLQDKQLNEALKMQQIATEYVPSLFGRGIYRYQQRLCLVTHYLPNALDGAKWLQKYGKLEENVGLVVAIRLAKALQAIHQSGILHLDLKPANVLLLPADLIEDWQIRIIDFGLSKLLPEFNTAGHTRTLTGNVSQFITASFEYASPEQKVGLKTTIASDVYSYGKTMFELLGDIGGFDVPDLLQVPLKKCLKIKPEERINLADLLITLNQLNGDEVEKPDKPSEEEKDRLIKEREELERQRREAEENARLIKERKKLEQERREHDKKVQEEQARLAKEREKLERERLEQEKYKREQKEREKLEQERREHEKKVQEEQTRLSKEREKLERQRREQEKRDQERKKQEELEQQRKAQENNKGTPRTFSTLKEGKQVECTVYEKTFDIKGVPLIMVYIPAGTFQMGSNNGYDDEKPVHPVEIKKPFYMGKFPVTQKQYQAIMGNNPSNWKGDQLPVESMDWEDAKEFCEKLSKLLKQEFRLPTEAEWEYACRANSQTKWSFGDNESDLKNYAWYYKNSDSKTHEVGQKKPNAFGLYDIHGNVWEWCEDSWENNYQTPRTQSAHENSSENKLLRGGSWGDVAEDCRSSCRVSDSGWNNDNDSGFRLALFLFPQDS
jgi:formylglycine-generating enzyme required for sulfatase activity